MELQTSKIIEKWDIGENIDWRLLSTREKKEWLLACLFRSGIPKGVLEKEVYLIDGDQINEQVDLYCLLGQTFIGEKGYMGQDLDGLHDCLIDLRVKPDTVLIVKNHKRLSDVLNSEFENYFDALIEILKQKEFRLKLE